jgi:hypothetical protein
LLLERLHTDEVADTLVLMPSPASRSTAAPAFNTGRIAKPIRGGGGPSPGAIQSPPTTTMSAAGALPGSPLSRVREDEGSLKTSTSQKRQSWFFARS